MELKELTGKKVLDAVDFSAESIKSWGDSYEDCQVCRFRLDGVVYSAVEDPDDGYRSHMRDLVVNENSTMTNVFEGQEVLCRYRDKSEYDTDDVLELVDTTTGKVVLEVGTRNTDDYYPWFTATFNPEAMAVNT